ncbi:MAG: MerR family DNA-binding protein [Ignavibacteriaceae bacterium]
MTPYYTPVFIFVLLFRRFYEFFTLNEIKELLDLRIESKATCGDIKKIAGHKIEDIEQKIKDLQNIKKVLTKLIHQCVNEELSSEECPILEAIEH